MLSGKLWHVTRQTVACCAANCGMLSGKLWHVVRQTVACCPANCGTLAVSARKPGFQPRLTRTSGRPVPIRCIARYTTTGGRPLWSAPAERSGDGSLAGSANGATSLSPGQRPGETTPRPIPALKGRHNAALQAAYELRVDARKPYRQRIISMLGSLVSGAICREIHPTRGSLVSKCLEKSGKMGRQMGLFRGLDRSGEGQAEELDR